MAVIKDNKGDTENAIDYATISAKITQCSICKDMKEKKKSNMKKYVLDKKTLLITPNQSNLL